MTVTYYSDHIFIETDGGSAVGVLWAAVATTPPGVLADYMAEFPERTYRIRGVRSGRLARTVGNICRLLRAM